MYSTVLSGALLGVNACMVQVEVDVSPGLPCMNMVGTLGSSVRESKERVFSAMKNIGLELPPKHITVNLSPADLHKEGTLYDLPIAVGLMEGLACVPKGCLEGTLFLGELGLNGEIRRVRGVLPIVRKAACEGIRECVIPLENLEEGALIPGITVRGAAHLEEVLLFLAADERSREEILPAKKLDTQALMRENGKAESADFSQVCGQDMAKRAAKIAAAGFHSLLMLGPPGAGKSMIAKRIPGILPPLTLEESLEVTSIYSVAGKLGDKPMICQRPFQSPHHTISAPALNGGGILPRPGMISLSHRGVLFLDELPEFQRSTLDSLRQPLEDKKIQIARASGNLVYPADFMLVGAMNPCPCGYFPDRNKCRCTEPQIKQYAGRVSGPILDRMDLCVELKTVEIGSLHASGNGESSSEMRRQVERARSAQEERFRGSRYRFNADVETADMERYCFIGEAERRFTESIYEKMNLSARSYHRIRKVARTIADLEGEERIREEHLMEAVMFRPVQEIWRYR